MLDPLGVVTKTRTSLDDQDDGLADAPSTITHREELQRQSTENYFYMPGLGEVPEIAVPDFLPDLAGTIIFRLLHRINYIDIFKVSLGVACGS